MKPIITKYSNAVGNKSQLSPSMHRINTSLNNNLQQLSTLLDKSLDKNDLGKEVGSINYVKNSNHFFIKTKSLQAHSFIPVFKAENVETINPNSFVNYHLQDGDVIISKDSNIGEVVILDRDYPNYMLSGALYKLPLSTHKLYVLAFIKSEHFRNQLDNLVPKGATIRHAGTKFLECKIPFPKSNFDTKIKEIENIAGAIIAIEKKIQENYHLINNIINSELKNNQKSNSFNFTQPNLTDLIKNKRIDTGTFSKTFKETDFLIKNYSNAYFYIDPLKFKSGNTPIVREINNNESLPYKWITPTNCSDVGYIELDESINMPTANNLNENSALIINRTSRGGRGEYVGITTFYDFSVYGKGHHNQGIYKVWGYSDDELIFLTCFFNSRLMRTYCSFLCVGSKMKELKTSQILSIPIPTFPLETINKIVSLFYTRKTINTRYSNFRKYL
jgi:type I restriction enzyme S subunit